MSTLFEDFAKKMVADSTQSLINALTKVMQDFNTKINDQFGENFKELNSAVKSMVIWQENYKNQVETLTSQFTKISENIHGIDRTLQTTAENHKVIYQTNEILKQVISDFSETVSSFSELGRQARDSFPIIEQNMNSLTESSNKYVRDSLSDIKLNYDEFSRNQKQISENYKSNIDQMILDNAERIKNLDNELGKELNKSLESLGSHLTTLSKHFVDDYKPLTEQLRKLLQLPKEINNEN
jgi:methyl-accepting chemotaxis protein